jgi:hypothetical protein
MEEKDRMKSVLEDFAQSSSPSCCTTSKLDSDFLGLSSSYQVAFFVLK